jgi:hypothetical protein
MRDLVAVLVLAAVSAFLTGCSGTENDVANYLTDQNKYEFYSCRQIARELESTTKRVRELERLMATASKGGGGEVISAITYRPELLKQRGNMNALLRTGREKHCDLAAARSDLNR